MTDRTELDEANKQAVRLVQRLHARRDFPAEVVTCAEDGQLWPCATRQAITQAIGDALEAVGE